MITITYDDFKLACPSAAMPNDKLFNSLSNFFEAAASEITAEFLTPELEARFSDCQISDYPTVRVVKNLIALKAYYLAIPQLDLVLTATGFGVVNNQNVAPASADRVERLRDTLLLAIEMNEDMLLYRLTAIDEWPGLQINSVFNYAKDMKYFGIEFPRRSDLRKYADVIARGEHHARIIMGTAMFDSLIEYLRREGDDKSLPLYYLANATREFIADASKENFTPVAVAHARSRLVHYLNTFVAEPELMPYINSSAYEANNYKRYENKKDDSTFFFGGGC